MKAPVRSDDFSFCDLLGGRCQENQEWMRHHFLVEVSPGAGFVVGGAFSIQALVSEMELFLHSFGETGS